MCNLVGEMDFYLKVLRKNKAQWISKLMEDCKQKSDETPRLKESTIKWTNNGSVKCMKFSQY